MIIKNRVVKFVAGLAFVLALTAGGGIAADEMGLEITSQAHAGTCGESGTSGGGC